TERAAATAARMPRSSSRRAARSVSWQVSVLTGAAGPARLLRHDIGRTFENPNPIGLTAGPQGWVTRAGIPAPDCLPRRPSRPAGPQSPREPPAPRRPASAIAVPRLG